MSNKQWPNARAAYLSISHCTHPDLDGTDKMLLVYLALNGDYATAENCRPGNRNLQDAVCLGRATHTRLRRLIERGLLERTIRGDGRGRASVYRIRWNSGYFPDRTPGGEELKPCSPECKDSDEKPCSLGCIDSPEPNEKPCSPDAETVQSNSGNRAVADEKPCSPDAETLQSRLQYTKVPPGEYKNLTNLPSENPENEYRTEGRTEGLSSSTAASAASNQEGLDDEYEELTDEEQAELERKEEAELERILDDDWKIFKRKVLDTEMRGVVVTNEQKKIMRMQVSFGNMDVVMEAIKTWIAKRSLPVDGLRTWAMWIQEGEPYIREVQQKHRLELRRDLWNRARDRINNISNELRSAGMEFKNAVPVEFWNTLDAKYRIKFDLANFEAPKVDLLREIADLYEEWSASREGATV